MKRFWSKSRVRECSGCGMRLVLRSISFGDYDKRMVKNNDGEDQNIQYCSKCGEGETIEDARTE